MPVHHLPVDRMPVRVPSQRSRSRLLLTRPSHAERAARALAEGSVVGHGFANFYVISTRPDAATVRSVNLLKGRPADQVGSLTTTPSRIADVWDLDRLPAGLRRREALQLVDTLFALGPFGFRGPAAAHVPDHLAQDDAGVRTAQVIAPGYACPSNDFIARALRHSDEDFLYITSANRSRHLTGAADEPAHFEAVGLRAEFGDDPRFVLLEHVEEEAARATYPAYAPMSTSILALHRLAPRAYGRPALVLERHGSLPLEDVRAAVAPLGFDVVLGAGATKRLELRDYHQPVQPVEPVLALA